MSDEAYDIFWHLHTIVEEVGVTVTPGIAEVLRDTALQRARRPGYLLLDGSQAPVRARAPFLTNEDIARWARGDR